MRFYIAVNEVTLELNIMSFWHKNIDGEEIIIPKDDTMQPISFPIPKKLKAECTKYVQNILEGSDVNEIFVLPAPKRPKKLKEIRKKYNQKLIKKLYEFRDLHAEEFL